jgi:hypothetical protein
MPKFAYIGVPTAVGGIGTTDLGGIVFLGTSLRALVYELTITFSNVPRNGALRGILRRGETANSAASGTVTALDSADSVLASPVLAPTYTESVSTILDFAINENSTYTWQAMDDDQRVVLPQDPDGDNDTLITAGCITTLANAGLLAVSDFKFETT